MKQYCILLSHQRSGSHAFKNILDETPKIVTLPEIFHPLPESTSKKINFYNFKHNVLKNSEEVYSPTRDAQIKMWDDYIDFLGSFIKEDLCVIDIKYNALHNMDAASREPFEKPLLAYLIRQRRVNILHLERRNVYAQVMSQLVARQTKQYHFFESKNSAGNENREAIEVNVDDLRELAGNLVESRKIVKQHFSGYRLFWQFYYEDVFSPEGALTDQTADMLQNIFNMKINNSCSHFKKSPPYDSSWIKNYDELEPLLRTGSPENL